MTRLSTGVNTVCERTDQNLLELSDYSKGAEYKINIQRSVTLLYDSNKQVEFEIKNQISFTLVPLMK